MYICTHTQLHTCSYSYVNKLNKYVYDNLHRCAAATGAPLHLLQPYNMQLNASTTQTVGLTRTKQKKKKEKKE